MHALVPYMALIYAYGVPRMTELLDIAPWPPLWASLSSSPTSKSCLVSPKIHRWEYMFVYKLWTVESQCAMSITKVFALGTARLIIQGRAGMTFGHSGTGMVNSIPQIREREGNGKNTFPKFGNGKGVRNSHSHNSGMGREWKKKTFP